MTCQHPATTLNRVAFYRGWSTSQRRHEPNIASAFPWLGGACASTRQIVGEKMKEKWQHSDTRSYSTIRNDPENDRKEGLSRMTEHRDVNNEHAQSVRWKDVSRYGTRTVNYFPSPRTFVSERGVKCRFDNFSPCIVLLKMFQLLEKISNATKCLRWICFTSSSF